MVLPIVPVTVTPEPLATSFAAESIVTVAAAKAENAIAADTTSTAPITAPRATFRFKATLLMMTSSPRQGLHSKVVTAATIAIEASSGRRPRNSHDFFFGEQCFRGRAGGM